MNRQKLIEDITESYRIHGLEDVEIGDTVGVHVRIQEGEKSRVQVFTGTVIARKGGGVGASLTVRRLVGTEGVERIFPVHCPSIVKVDIKKKGRVRRAKLYYLRDRVGKATKVQERRRRKHVQAASKQQPAAGEKPADENAVS